ncbi:CPCC family cysteine-rich protein [Endozoicomonas numazuensis]|uniref:Hydrolase n=1 Tax=Endozoicomonas numazuensis TaxID=1137799 RepID=A0A081N191_9GAMM|nr:CPCC family cysteine-rich protein [Endozoicomonas numazuensis]KEQ12214.1 hydrolase [Endozoicomonas numazuensis]
MNSKRYQCSCCNYLTLSSNSDSSFDICPVCYWENDCIQNENPDYEGGANDISLNQAKENYKKYGASDKRFLTYVRPPSEEEISIISAQK